MFFTVAIMERKPQVGTNGTEPPDDRVDKASVSTSNVTTTSTEQNMHLHVNCTCVMVRRSEPLTFCRLVRCVTTALVCLQTKGYYHESDVLCVSRTALVGKLC